MGIKPWHITTLVCLLAVAGLAVAVVRAFRKGRRGD